jgi:hypothetical protein
METLPILSALVNIFNHKEHEFLYVVKNIANNAFLPKVRKATVQNVIKGPGLYNILYRSYTNKDGYDAIFIVSAQKIVTK